MNGRVVIALAAANLGLLFVADGYLPHVTSVIREGSVVTHAPYAPVVAAVAGLLAWQWAPRRAWSWLLLAGALCAVPRAVGLLDDGPVNLPIGAREWTVVAAPVLTLIGALGAASLGWRAGYRRSAAVLFGLALTLPLLAPAMYALTGPGYVADVLPTLVAVVTAVGLVAAVGAVVGAAVSRTLPDCPAPSWRVTVAGCVGATAALVTVIWEPISTSGVLEDAVRYRALTLAAVGLLVGAVAGWRVLLAAVAAGLPLAIFALGFLITMWALPDTPALAGAALAGGVVAGVLLTLPAWRPAVGPAALVLVAAGLIVLFFQVDTVGPIAAPTERMVAALAPALLAIALVAAVTVSGSAGDALAEAAAAPAALAGVAIPFTLLTFALVTLRWDMRGEVRVQPPDILLLSAAGLVVSALALLALTVADRRRPAAEPEAPPAESRMEPGAVR